MNSDEWCLYLEWLHEQLGADHPPVALFVDQHSSRFSLRALRLCKAFNIIVIAFPPNLTWLLQVRVPRSCPC
jgi:hypothetical protein